MASEHHRAGLRFKIAESGEGATLLFQHGLCGDAAQPSDLFPPGIGWRCLTLECRGHGGSDAGPGDGFSIATFADDVASLIEARALAPVALGGVSMGAAIAMRLAALRPNLVRALVLVRPAWLDEAAPANMQPNALVGDLLASLPAPEARARFEASGIAQKLHREAPDNLASLRGFFARQPLAVTRDLLRRIAADGPGVTADQIGAIAAPTLVIGCARDFIHPLAMARLLADKIPFARFVEVAAKADDSALYRNQTRAALAAFLKEIAP